MERRTVILLLAIVLAVAVWSIFLPKPTLLDNSWHCPNLGDGAAQVCIRKPS